VARERLLSTLFRLERGHKRILIRCVALPPNKQAAVPHGSRALAIPQRRSARRIPYVPNVCILQISLAMGSGSQRDQEETQR